MGPHCKYLLLENLRFIFQYRLHFLIVNLLLQPALTFSQNIKTLDGVEIGDRSRLVQQCINGADAKEIEFNGISFSARSYCSCVIDKVFPTILSGEILMAMKNDNVLEVLLQEDRLDIIMECAEKNVDISDDFKISDASDIELAKMLGIRQCVNEILSDKDQFLTPDQAIIYCECAVERVFDMGYTYGEINEIDNENSNIFNEVAIPCMNSALKDIDDNDSVLKEYDTPNNVEVIGYGISSEVPLVDYLGMAYKVKLNISGVESYFLLDTGASNIVIDRKIERELLLNGSIKREDYLDESSYIMANNETVVAQNINLREIKIGNYTVKNVKAAVIDGISLLCGQSFLDSFSKWEINKFKKVLTLYK